MRIQGISIFVKNWHKRDLLSEYMDTGVVHADDRTDTVNGQI